MNFKLIIQYDGTRYGGWQRQKNRQDTIQGKTEDVLSRFFGKKIEISGSGRTDAGVHALAQVASFSTDTDKTAGEVLEYLNRYLPDDISVIAAECVPKRFHARLCAKEKVYLYRVRNAKKHSVFGRKYETLVKAPLDIEKMKTAAAYFIGKHDFCAFCSNKHMKKSTVRTIYDINIEKDGDLVEFTYRGNGFLYNMVRIITGTMLEVGLGERNAEEIPQILLSGNREVAGKTAPAQGLFLKEIIY